MNSSLLLLFFALTGASAQAPALNEEPKLEFLSDIFDEIAIDHEQDWGVLGKDITARKDRRSEPVPLRIGEQTYLKGIGHHANGKILLRLRGEYSVLYPRLLVSQIAILLLFGKISLDLTRGRGWFAIPRRWLATALLGFGTVYLSVMVIRYFVRMSLYPAERWTGGAIPIFFHCVRAGAVLLIGSYHRHYSHLPSNGRFRRHPWLRKGAWTLATLLLTVSMTAWVAYLVAPAWLAGQLGFTPPQYAVRVDRAARMRTRDSVELVADVFHPRRAGPKTPTILVRLPYTPTFTNRLFINFVGRMWAEHGYSVVIQGTRGRGESGGKYQPLLHERKDGLDTLEWLSRQPWYDGRLGMWGGAYFGYTQWVLADRLDAGHTALLIQEASTDFYSTFYPGGAFALESALYWALRSHGDTDHVVTEDQLRRGADGLPTLEADNRALLNVDFFDEWASHSERDDFWHSIDGESRASRLQSPLLLMGGWYDPFLPTLLRDYEQIKKSARPEVAASCRLVIAPWIHADTVRFRDRPLVHNFRFESLAPSLPWFDRHLKGSGAEPLPAVKIFVLGINEWRSENEWPLARADYMSLFLHSGGGANTASGDGCLSWDVPGAQRSDRYTYDPMDPVPSAGGAMLGFRAGIALQNEIEKRPDVLVYSTEPLAEDLEVTGPIQLVLYATSDAPSTDFTGKLVDVHPDGSAFNVSSGIKRLEFDSPEPEAPVPAVEIKIALWPTSMVFLRGHRIRLEVSSSNYPRFDRNPNTGGFIPGERRTVRARQRVFHTAEYPSRIILPLIRDKLPGKGE